MVWVASWKSFWMRCIAVRLVVSFIFCTLSVFCFVEWVFLCGFGIKSYYVIDGTRSWRVMLLFIWERESGERLCVRATLTRPSIRIQIGFLCSGGCRLLGLWGGGEGSILRGLVFLCLDESGFF
jgi:hypothetical protein